MEKSGKIALTSEELNSIRSGQLPNRVAHWMGLNFERSAGYGQSGLLPIDFDQGCRVLPLTYCGNETLFILIKGTIMTVLTENEFHTLSALASAIPEENQKQCPSLTRQHVSGNRRCWWSSDYFGSLPSSKLSKARLTPPTLSKAEHPYKVVQS